MCYKCVVMSGECVHDSSQRGGLADNGLPDFAAPAQFFPLDLKPAG